MPLEYNDQDSLGVSLSNGLLNNESTEYAFATLTFPLDVGFKISPKRMPTSIK